MLISAYFLFLYSYTVLGKKYRIYFRKGEEGKKKCIKETKKERKSVQKNEKKQDGQKENNTLAGNKAR